MLNPLLFQILFPISLPLPCFRLDVLSISAFSKWGSFADHSFCLTSFALPSFFSAPNPFSIPFPNNFRSFRHALMTFWAFRLTARLQQFNKIKKQESQPDTCNEHRRKPSPVCFDEKVGVLFSTPKGWLSLKRNKEIVLQPEKRKSIRAIFRS